MGASGGYHSCCDACTLRDVIPGALLRILAQGDAATRELRNLARLREGGCPVEVATMQGPPAEAVTHARAAGASEPLGVVVETHSDAFAALAAGADEAWLLEGLDLPRFIAFLDRISLRAMQRREMENRQASAAHAEKLAALGTVVAGVAHEINNPLAIVILNVEGTRAALEPLLRTQEEVFRLAQRGGGINAYELTRLAELAQTGAAPSDVRADLDDVDAALRTITEVVRDLRIFARAEGEEKTEPVYLPDLIDNVLRIVGKQITSVATLERDYGADVPTLLLPRSRLTQVLTNLLINAAHAIAEVQRPMHRVRISLRCDTEAIALSVSDTGPGIAPDIIERIFDPFFTTKRGDRGTGGTGLGLSISRSILHDLGGDLIVESVHGAGATFIAMIPTEARRVQRISRPLVAERPATQNGRYSILIVEDEEALLRSLATTLRQRFHVLLAADGQEAIDLLSSDSRPDIVLCDLALPLVSGFQLYDWLQKNRPELARRTVFMTANAADGNASKFIASIDRPLIEKPVTRSHLMAVLERVASDLPTAASRLATSSISSRLH